MARLAALRGDSRLSSDVLALEGLSDRNMRLLLNNLGELVATYVEIGTYVGSTLVAVAYGNPALVAVGIDNFSERFSTLAPEVDIRTTLTANVARYAPHVRVIEADFKKVDPACLPPAIECLFYDAAHDFDSQYEGIVRFAGNYADECVLIVDDWNGEQVRDATYAGLADVARRTGHHVSFSAALCDTWNNVGVFVLSRGLEG
jgi:hypothetical protein